MNILRTDSFPLQMSNSTQSKLLLLASLQKKYLCTSKNIVTKPNEHKFLRNLFEQYRIEKYLWQLTGFYPPIPFISTIIIFCCLFSLRCVKAVFKFFYLLTYYFIFLLLLCINVDC